jgi:exodeoxyribonuclease VIII
MQNFNPTNPEEGIYPNLPEPIYRKAPGISQSALKEMEYSPAHYRSYVTAPPTPSTPDQLIGTMTHALILQKKELFTVIPADAPKMPTKAQVNAKKPSDETKEAISWWNQFRTANPGRELIDREDADRMYAMQRSVLAHPIASEVLKRASGFEVAAFKLHHTGLLMKGLADCVCTDDNNMTTIPDLKTTGLGGASFYKFRKAIFDWGYHRQAAYYLDLFGASFFMFIVVEKEPPYAVACYNLLPASLHKGRSDNERDLEKRRCMIVIYMEISNMLRSECEKLSNK